MESFNHVAKLAQKCCENCPVLVVGSGLTIPFGLPTMSVLARHLIETVHPANREEEDSWLLVRTALSAGDHLEQALLKHTVAPSLVPQIVGRTWDCVAAADESVFLSAVQQKFASPLSDLLAHFFNSSILKIDVVTTNYDRVVEYACDLVGIHYSSAFQASYVTPFDSQDKRSLTKRGKPVQTVRLWKVHGSLDWFVRDDGVPFRAPLFSNTIEGVRPLIVTPGVSKYERLTDEPFRSTLQGMDGALSEAGGYLCFGFGFRDRQIEPKIVERLTRKNVPIVVATQRLTDEATTFLKMKAKANFLALEECDGGTIARTQDNWDGIKFDSDFWSVGGFLKLITAS